MTHTSLAKNQTIIRFLTFITLVTLSGCTPVLHNYAGTTPAFNMQSFFTGKLQAYGMVQNRSGEVIRRFHVDLTGSWEGNKGLLEEDFYYADGKTQRRVWTLIKQDDGSYVGTASDVQGKAVGEAEGFAFNWQYTLAIEVDGETWDIHLNDWLFQLDSSRLINRTKMTKWGFNVGEITLIIEKETQG